MAAETDPYTLTSATYRDLSEGATNCSFIVTFTPQSNPAIRLIMAPTQPTADATNYALIDPAGQRVSAGYENQSIFVRVAGLATTDRVWARADSTDVALTVFRK